MYLASKITTNMKGENPGGAISKHAVDVHGKYVVAGQMLRPHLIDFMFHGSGRSDFCSLQKKKKKKSGRAPAHAYEHKFVSS